MTSVGLFGIALSLLTYLWAGKEHSNRRLGLITLMIMLHLASAMVYYLYVQSNDADTKLYYFDDYGFYGRGFAYGTMTILYATQWVKEKFGGTYLDFFFLYQVFGIWGIGLLLRTFDEVAKALQRPLPDEVLALMFFPGMYFWTSAIGKDAPLFFACNLVVWAAFAPLKRAPWFFIGIAVMTMVRPHIALASVASLAAAFLVGRGIPTWLRVVLFVGVAGALVGLVFSVQDSLQVDLSSVGSIADYVENSTTTAASVLENSDATLPYPFKLISLLFRPFFIDGNGIFGFFASLQNVVMVYLVYVAVRNIGVWRQMFNQSLPTRFITFHYASIIFILSVMYYNVGLGLRQREMATPAMLALFCAIRIIVSIRAEREQAQVPVARHLPA